MEKNKIKEIVKDTWKECMEGGKEKFYISEEDVLIYVASYETYKKEGQEVISSEAHLSTNPEYRGVVYILKEEVKSEQMLYFILLHEIGHLMNGHEEVSKIMSLEEDMKREKEADYYALEKGGFNLKEVSIFLKQIHERFISCGVKEVSDLFEEKLRIRLQNIKEFEKGS